MEFNEYFDKLSDKRVAVIGIAVSNKPLIRMLLDRGIDVTARDKRELSQFGGELEELVGKGLKLQLGSTYLDRLEEDIIYRTPAISLNTAELKEAAGRGLIISSEIEAFFETCPCPIIAVTGSDGKTTTASLIAEILTQSGHRAHLGGNIGKPLLESVPDIKPSDYAVLELSSFQLMGMEKSPHIAAITNIAPNHLDYHADMKEYTESKKNIFTHQGKKDLLVLNYDNDITKSFYSEARGDVRFFSRSERVGNGCYFDGTQIMLSLNGREESVIKRSEILLPGLHNIDNLMTAFCTVVDIAGVFEACRAVAKSFRGVEHRVEFVRERNGVRFYNDAIASSPTRSIAGLLSFDRKVIVISGGYDKNIPYESFGQVLRERAKAIVLSGATAPKIRAAAESAHGAEKCPAIYDENDFEKAVKLAANLAEPGDIVILSPASASFDQFKNFEEKGRAFKRIIMEL